MDSKLYIEWSKKLDKWVIEYRGEVVSQHNTQAEAEQWKQAHYPNYGYEIERVQVRRNSPRGAKIGEWR